MGVCQFCGLSTTGDFCGEDCYEEHRNAMSDYAQQKDEDDEQVCHICDGKCERNALCDDCYAEYGVG